MFLKYQYTTCTWMFTFITDVSTFTIHQSIGTGVAGTLLNSNRKIINLLWVR